jgi:Protein of unknown function (DUF2975)
MNTTMDAKAEKGLYATPLVGAGRLTKAMLSVVRLGSFVGRAGLICCIALAGLCVLAGLMGGQFGPLVLMTEWRAMLPAILSGALHALALLLICDRLEAFLRDVAKQDPFAPENPARLREIGWCLALLELGRYGIQGLTAIIIGLVGQPQSGTLSPQLDVSLTAWAGVLVLFVLAEIFREGARLRHNDRLTI